MYSRVPRFPDWTQRLSAFLQARAKTPFAWVHNDCCTFAADAVIAQTGADPMAGIRKRYTTEVGALRLIKASGGLRPLVCSVLGMPMEHLLMASRGDVVLLENAGRHEQPVLGVCVGTEAAAPGPSGMRLIPMSAASAAWRI